MVFKRLDKNGRLTTLVYAIEQELKKKIGAKPLPSLKKQFARLKKLDKKL